MKDTVEIRLPAKLTSTTLRRALKTGFPLTTSSGDISSLECRFAPPESTKKIEIHATAVEDWTIEGLASMQAFHEWLTTAADASIQVEMVSKPSWGDAPLDRTFSVPSYSSEAMPERWTPGTQVLFKLTSLNGSKEAAAPSGHEAVAPAAARMVRLIGDAYGAHVQAPPTTALIHEFFLEGLLNVLEHTAPAGSTGERAWVGARVYDAADRLDAMLARRSEDERVAEWLRAAVRLDEKVLELVIVDIGMGVAKSLADVYLEQERHRQVAKPHWWEVHDEVLRWALSAFGSRKLRDGFSDDVFARAWRGLYRVLFRANTMDGLVTLRSGVGMYGRGTAGPSAFEMRVLEVGEGADRGAMPWTSLHLLLPLSSKPNGSREERELERFERIAMLPFDVRKRTHEILTKTDFDRAHREYARAIQESVKGSHVEVERARPEVLRYNPVVAVIHPLTTIDMRSFGTTLPPVERVEQADQYLADAAVRLFVDAAIPGIVPIHIGLRIDPETADEVQRRFALRHGSLSPDVNLQLCGMVNALSGRIHWLLFIDNDPEAANLVDNGMLETQGEPPGWWHEVSQLYSGFFTIEHAERDDAPQRTVHRIRFHGPSSLSAQAVMDILAKLQEGLHARAVAEERPWLWQAGSARTEFVRTTSNRYVRQFVSVNALCAEEPVFEDLLRMAAQRVLLRRDQKQPWLVVPDSEAASFLARRLFEDVDGMRVCEVEDLPEEYSPDHLVCLFTDASFAGTRLRDRGERIQATAPVAQMLICCNLRPKELETPAETECSLIRWPLAPPIPEEDLPPDCDILTVDEMTNEVLPRGMKEEVEKFALGLSSKENDAVETVEALAERGVLTYGLIWIEDRLHLARCSTKQLLLSAEWRARVIDDVAARITPRVVNDPDVIFISRHKSSAAPHLATIAEGVVARLQKQKGWRGTAFATTVPTTRRGQRQILRRQLTATMRDAMPLRSRASRAHSPLFSKPVPGQSAVIVYIDNAAITGHAINEVALAVARAEPRASVLLAYTVVNKLVPSAERMWPAVSIVEREGETPLRFEFGSLLQLRVAISDRFEGTSLHLWLTRLARVARELGLDGGRRIASEIDATVARISDSRLGMTLQFPLGPADTEEVRIGAAALRLRHVITAYLDGLPVLHLLVEQFRTQLRECNADVLFVLALEPDLLPERVLSVIADDLLDVIQAVLAKEHHVGRLRNALLVAVQLGDRFVRRAGTICVAALSNPDTAAHFVVLVVDFIEQGRGRRLSENLLRTLRETFATHPHLFRDRYLPVIEAAVRARTASRPTNAVAAVSQIERFLVKARGYHASVGFGAWWKLTEVLVMPSQPDESEVTAVSRQDALWSEARQFLEEEIVPTIYGLALLTRDIPRAYLDQTDKVVRNAVAAFEFAAQEAHRVGRGAEEQETVCKAWQQVLTATLGSTVQILYARSGAVVIGDAVRSSVLDNALPFVVQEPVELLLHFIEATFKKDLQIHLTVRILDDFFHVDYLEVLKHLTAVSSKMWEGPQTFGIRIGGGDILRNIFRILVGNIRRHAPDAPEIVADFRIDEHTTTLTLENKINFEKDTKGQGYGLKDIDSLAARLGAGFSHELLPTKFRAILTFGTQLIRLPERGVS